MNQIMSASEEMGDGVSLASLDLVWNDLDLDF